MKIDYGVMSDVNGWYNCHLVEESDTIMTVDVLFTRLPDEYDNIIYDGIVYDGTQFDIGVYDSDGLKELFKDFCKENDFDDVYVCGVEVLLSCKDYDELLKIDCR